MKRIDCHISVSKHVQSAKIVFGNMLLPIPEVEQAFIKIHKFLPNTKRVWKKVASNNKLRQYFYHSGANLFSSSSAEKTKNILFFGTDNFSLQTLKLLNKYASHNKSVDGGSKTVGNETNRLRIGRVAVCTSQMKHLVQPVKLYAEQNNIEVYPWPLDSTIVKNEGFDIGVVSSFGHMIPKKIINAFPQGMINVHASLLPRWRGASPITHAIMAGDSKTGISIMEIKPHHFDIGKVLAKQSIDIGCDQTKEELTNILATIGAELMVRVLQDLESYRASSISQSEEGITYAPCINKSFYNIDWNSSSSRDVYNQSRALSGSGKLYSTWEKTGVNVMFENCLKPDIVDSFIYKLNEIDYRPGEVKYHKTKLKDSTRLQEQSKFQRFICIKCKTGWAVFQNFYYGTNKKLSAVDFFNGYISKQKTEKHFFTNKIT